MSQKRLQNVLEKLSPGQVQVVLCQNITENLTYLLDTAHYIRWQRVITHVWEQLPNQSQAIADVVETLAQVAFELWPAWYQQDELFIEAGTSVTDILMNRYACSSLQATRDNISLPWLKEAVRQCQQQNVPCLPDFPHSLQLTQLAFALDSDGLILAIAHPQPASHCLLGLAKAITWIADHTHSRLLLLLPESLSTADELESVLYGAISLHDIAVPPTAVPQETKYTIFPIHGRPHPFSPGEQKLAVLLGQDDELAPLFKFNQQLQSVRLSQFIVDLLWSEGRVVVEIDGYRHHGSRFGFSCDRNRDYELLISDYIVLRLPHDEVMADAEVAIEKIRDVVRFRRQQLLSLHEVRS
ncbi:hypothetical protein N836_19115 [Leptolyngbya sp. Heron Island J]|uniref:endonuclease domain-containing protein n=1 Tax=Leptolyngbya sp. Heron Island J TaxID=1385935 RepID=UPI0003B9EEF7|nr:DUF559 domain-containing protein [Leptolyngbya sp. Heron Island J]ESA33983.1 hypothetical protein N836_19115 [Leptolyngbya sp. Heron Island J]